RPIRPMSTTSMKAMITTACPDCLRNCELACVTSDQHRRGFVHGMLVEVDRESQYPCRGGVRPVEANAVRRLGRRDLVARRQWKTGVKCVAARVGLVVWIGGGVEVAARARRGVDRDRPVGRI